MQITCNNSNWSEFESLVFFISVVLLQSKKTMWTGKILLRLWGILTYVCSVGLQL